MNWPPSTANRYPSPRRVVDVEQIKPGDIVRQGAHYYLVRELWTDDRGRVKLQAYPILNHDVFLDLDDVSKITGPAAIEGEFT